MEFAQGIIISVIAGYYYVEHAGKAYLCRARGKLRLDDLPPMAGDMVLFSPGPDDTGTVEQVLPRRNYLLRPAVANIDAVIIVLAPEKPAPNLLMADKLLALIKSQGLSALLCINKADLGTQAARELADIYKDAGVTTVICSALTGEGMGALLAAIGGMTVVLAGQSGVGKSHISSRIAGKQLELPVQVGNLSAKIGRGKHTTRQVSLLPLPGGGKVADTPGFSVFELEMESRELQLHYPEFSRSALCKFSPCSHIHEPECAIKQDVEAGQITKTRYDNYVKIYYELVEKEANRY
ncbi:MAG: ribosome small subunit-dependent GTPase A [Bacillota bacterium]|jgi:ribosome biogenesis GTPase|nr:ribosome small subunit-dependent GTPase A [Bacillota bacterium]HPZ21667.1 ribosome small subunit-dependent GTPase A [Bacillota bacterium]HQD19505.1 ribosome small subunit-dependent GTPase A [Bacillota bacterium]